MIEDVDEFKKSMGCVEFNITLTNAGVELHNLSYADQRGVRELIQDYERSWRKAATDSNASRRRTSDDRKRPKYTVKCKYDPDDIGSIHVWNEHGSPKQWVTLQCTDENAQGMPLWLQQQCSAFADREAMAYCTPEDQAVVRARLLDEIANVNAASSERSRQTLAKALADKNVRKLFGQFAAVHDEDRLDSSNTDNGPAPNTSVGSELSTGARKDGLDQMPRSKTTPAREPARVPRREPRPSTASDRLRSGSKSAANDRRDAGGSRKQAGETIAPRSSSSRAGRLKWGEEI